MGESLKDKNALISLIKLLFQIFLEIKNLLKIIIMFILVILCTRFFSYVFLFAELYHLYVIGFILIEYCTNHSLPIFYHNGI